LKAEFTAIIEAAKESLRAAIELVLDDHRADMLRGLPAEAIQATAHIG